MESVINLVLTGAAAGPEGPLARRAAKSILFEWEAAAPSFALIVKASIKYKEVSIKYDQNRHV